MTIVPGLFLVLFLVCSLFKSLSLYVFLVFLLTRYAHTGMKRVYGYLFSRGFMKRVGTSGNWEQVGVQR